MNMAFFKDMAKKRSMYLLCSDGYTNVYMYHSGIELYIHKASVSVSYVYY